MRIRLWSHLNDTARQASAGVAGRLGLQVVGLFMDNDSFVQYGICAFEGQPVKNTFETGHALFIGFQVTEVADVLLGIRGRTMLRFSGIEMTAGRTEIRSRTVAF